MNKRVAQISLDVVVDEPHNNLMNDIISLLYKYKYDVVGASQEISWDYDEYMKGGK